MRSRQGERHAFYLQLYLRQLAATWCMSKVGFPFQSWELLK